MQAWNADDLPPTRLTTEGMARMLKKNERCDRCGFIVAKPSPVEQELAGSTTKTTGKNGREILILSATKRYWNSVRLN